MIGLSAGYKGHVYRSADDRLDLYARIYDDCTDGIPILMMHGLTRNSADFENIAEILQPDYRLIIADQRGRGLSEYDTSPANYTPQIYAQDMFALLKSLNVERTILLGTSMGGIIAMLMAAMYPEKIYSLILNDVGPEVSPAGIERLQQYVGKKVDVANWSDAAEYCKQINACSLPDYGDKDWLNFARRTFIARKNGIPTLAHDPAIAEGLAGEKPSATPADLWPMWNLLSGIPTLSIRGATSDILSPETVTKMADRHRALFSQVVVPSRGHAPMLDELAAVEAIKEFLERNEP